MKKKLPFILLLLILISLPFVFNNPYYLNIIITFGIFSIFALSLNFIVGYIGEISFGHAAFFGLGAYFTTLIHQSLEFPYFISLLISLVLTGLVGMCVGFLSLRLQGVHFAIITLAFAEVFRLIILNLTDITRGAMGLSVSSPTIPFTQISLTDPMIYYYFVCLFLVGVIYFIKFILRTPFGRGILAIKEGSLLASSIGIHVSKYKIIAFTISAVIAGLAGALYGPFVGIITPDLLSVHYTTEALLMVIVGGKGFLLGPLFGAFIFTVIPEFLWMSPEVQLLVFGVILVLSIKFMPKGIANLIKEIRTKMQKDTGPKRQSKSSMEKEKEVS
ncbi:branched-chain amino acid ABC transporter permease [Neobacillus drentensis]|uniref:branched-chain amino acid ABC transporter permease n=1 Tax=Neobacillus drentensis TaxID=220684 RepID=UPI0008242E6B|nr:branched-chain amino acid ABC transporter permease [Neobacillus drentensis]